MSDGGHYVTEKQFVRGLGEDEIFDSRIVET